MAGLSADSRRALYREGKRLLGVDRMQQLRKTAQLYTFRARLFERRIVQLSERLKPALRIDVSTHMRIDDQGIFLAGCAGSRPAAKRGSIKLTLQFDDGEQCDVSDTVHWYSDSQTERTNGTSQAFALICDLPPYRRIQSIIISHTDVRMFIQDCAIPSAATSPLDKVISLLTLLGHCAGNKRELLDSVLGSAIQRTWMTRGGNSSSAQNKLQRYNEALAPKEPRTSLIIPLYGRYDFMTHQLAHFTRDDEIRACEIIYVLDDPKLGDAVRSDALNLEHTHDIAFCVLYLDRNLGFAGANNAAVQHARGDDLLLLNSDVLPEHAGWLGHMYASMNQPMDNYVLGARLLYLDNTVQHNGMEFEASDNFNGLWLNRHPGKGLPRMLFSNAKKAETREAVTGACLLVSRQRYLSLGGLDEGYIFGDFEDSDFCMKARLAKMQIAIAPRAVLYHLERQSQALVTKASWKRDLSHYNCWLHTQRWHHDIETLKTGSINSTERTYG